MSSDRLVPASDLVLQRDIVDRLNMSPQLVANLASGRAARRAPSAFPRPVCGRGSRGIWLWSEVKAWYDEYAPRTVEAMRAAERLNGGDRRPRNWAPRRAS